MGCLRIALEISENVGTKCERLEVEPTEAGVEAAKAKGNACFQQGDVAGAIAWFTAALPIAHEQKLEVEAVLFTNRALGSRREMGAQTQN